MQIESITKDAYHLFHEGIIALNKATMNGMRVDLDYCEKQLGELTALIDKHSSRFWETDAGKLWKTMYGQNANINSDHQLSKVLYKGLKIEPVKFTDKSTEDNPKPSVDNEALSMIALPAVKHILYVRKYSKARDTYLLGFMREQVDGILRPFFSLHLVQTFRSSSQNPNFQNQPKRDQEIKQLIRSAIFARLGHCIGAADFSGAEIYTSLFYHQDPKFEYDIVHGDMHKDLAVELYLLDSLDKNDSNEKNFRQGSKNGFVFPQFYGDYYLNCVSNLLDWAKRSARKDGTPGLIHLSDKGLIRLDKHGQIKNKDKFIEHVKNVEDDFWNVRYKIYQKWKEKQLKLYQKRGYVELLTGFRCSGVMKKNQITNYPIQGTAFHCLLWSFIEMTNRLEEEHMDSYLIGQIHDEMLGDVAENETTKFFKLMKQVTEVDLKNHWSWVTIPMKIEATLTPVDGSWYESKDYDLNDLN